MSAAPSSILIDKVGKQFLEGQYGWMVDGVYLDTPPIK